MLTAVGAHLQQGWRGYEDALHSRPMLTQAVTSAVLWTVGDIVSQKMVSRGKFNLRRTAWTGFFGGVFVGPPGHGWYKVLDGFMAKHFIRGTPIFVAAKVAADELTFTPLHLIFFLTFMTKVQGGTWDAARAKLKHDFWSAYLAELTVWPIFQCFNFGMVPVRHQLLAVNLASLADSVFLTWLGAEDDWLASFGLSSARRQASESAASLEEGLTLEEHDEP